MSLYKLRISVGALAYIRHSVTGLTVHVPSAISEWHQMYHIADDVSFNRIADMGHTE